MPLPEGTKELENLENDSKINSKCPNGELNCFFENGAITICSLAPCNLSKYETGIHERIIDHYIEKEQWDDAYYYFKKLMDKNTFNCSLIELEKIKLEKPNYEAKDLPPACRLFYLAKEMKEVKGTIKFLERKGKYEELSVEGRKKLMALSYKFISKMNSSIQLLDHIVKDERYKQLKKLKAQERVIEKIEVMGKFNVQYKGQFGTEVDESIKDDEKILFADDPALREDTGVFKKEREQKKKQKEKQKQKEKKEKGAIT